MLGRNQLAPAVIAVGITAVLFPGDGLSQINQESRGPCSPNVVLNNSSNNTFYFDCTAPVRASTPVSKATPSAEDSTEQRPKTQVGSKVEAKSNSRTFLLRGFSSWDRFCYPRALPEIEIVTQPRYGTISVKVGDRLITGTAFGETQCVGKTLPGQLAYYVPSANMPEGATDHVVLRAKYFDGMRTIAKNYDFSVRSSGVARR